MRYAYFDRLVFLVFTVKPGDIIARLGSPARLDCQTDMPDTLIRWSRGDDTMVNFDTCNCQMLSNFSLYFNETTLNAGGVYVCLTLESPPSRATGSITIAGKIALQLATDTQQLYVCTLYYM